LLLLTMLAGALNYANNAALLLTCLLGAASAASMLVAFRNLNGLQLSSLQASHAIAGQPVELTLRFASAPARDALRLYAGDARQVFAVPAQGSVAVTINMATTRRGWQPTPRLKIWTTWPLGMFRAWSWVHPDQRMLIWPCARTIVGATIVAAAPAVATFRKRRRLDALPLLDLVIVVSRLDDDPFWDQEFCWEKTRTCAVSWQECFGMMRR